MQIRFWGTRGSIATPGPGTVRFGGNTSCVQVRADSGAVVVLDCGTGARALGIALSADATARGQAADGYLLIGHTHWDHIQGLPFFAPLFAAGNTWQVYGPRGLGQSLAHTLAGQMQYAYFPVAVDQLGARVSYHDLVEGAFALADIGVRAQYLNHTALTLGYRLEVDGVTLVYACDHEPNDPALAGGGDLLASPADARHVEFLRGADVVIHDAQYLAEEYPGKVGWGHSTVEYAVDAARLAQAGQLVLFHHDPLRDDAAVDALVQRAYRHAAAVGYPGAIVAAAEGMTLDLRRRDAPATGRSGPARSATYEPAAADLAASVVVAAADLGLRTTIRAAADAEQLPVRFAEQLPELANPAQTVVVVDHDETVDALAALRRLVAGSGPAGLAVIGVTRGRPPRAVDGLVTDWVVWPSTTGHLRTKLRAAVLRRACRWQSAPLPPDEQQRLRSLHALGLLDTEPEERFDRYTKQACESLGMPVALVTLVDADRQWFKSRQGVKTQETARDESLCAHAILGTELLQVPDLLADDRFADSPAAQRARFYAGVPLVLSDGSRVGTFCVADQRPRVLDKNQIEQLHQLAACVRAELEETLVAP